MTEFMKMDIFFFVTTVCVVFVAIFIIVFLAYLSRFVNKMTDLAEELRHQAGEIGEEAEEFLERINESFIVRLIFGKRKKSRSKKK